MEWGEDIDRLVIEEFIWLDRKGISHTGFVLATWWESRCLMKHVTGPNGDRPIFGNCWLVRIHSDPHIYSENKDWQKQLDRMLHRGRENKPLTSQDSCLYCQIR